MRGSVCVVAVVWGLTAASPSAADECLDCHDKAAIGRGGGSVHAPFDEGDCTACHGDHGDDGRLVLAVEGNALCDGCHDTAESGFLKAHGDVRVARARCVSCHDPHRSAEAHLLVPNRHRPLAYGRCDSCHRFDGRLQKPVPELCLGCHGGEEFTRRIAHLPVRRGECLACHDPHASREPFLLTARYAPGREGAGEGDVALCFGCHDRAAFSSGDDERTLFRSAGRNYHTLHLSAVGGLPAPLGAASRALSCRACHEVHSSERPRLVRRELDCDGVPCLKLEYRRTETGGHCISGCHGPQSYVFLRGGGAPPAPPPAQVPKPAGRNPGAAPAETTPLQESINRRCVVCHVRDVRRFARANTHAPVRSGSCGSCHLDHGSENRLILQGTEERICGRCHDLRGAAPGGAHRAFPLAGARCTECHDPHGSEGRGLLRPVRHAPFADNDCGACHGQPDRGWRIGDEAARVCRDCHDDVGRGKHPHTALAARGCLGCHSAHAASEPALLRKPIPELCLSCHPSERFAGESVHAPVREGDCSACHPAHEAAEPRLLTRPYPLEQYAPYDRARFGLCWECHDEGALTDPARGGDTGFADGARNLHALHLRDRESRSEFGTRVQPGVTCRNCHDPHASESPRLIRRVLDCNGVPCLQVEYRKVGAGGSCMGGCHVTKSYLPGR